MKMVCLLGSARVGGYSTALAARFREAAEERGVEVETFALNKLSYRGCQSCLVCKKKLDRCALDDDLTPVLDAVRACDVLVIATPIYMSDVPGPVKSFIDRTYSFVGADYMTNPHSSRLESGKSLVFIQTQGAEAESMYTDVFPKYEFFFKWYGFTTTRLVRAVGLPELEDRPLSDEAFGRVEEAARTLLGGT